MKNLKWAIGVLVVIIITAWVIKYFNTPTNTEITNITVPVKQRVDTLFISDSVRAIQQEMLLTQDREIINNLQDSLQRVINRAARIKPEMVVKWRENFVDTYTVGKLKDSLSTVIDDLIAKSHEVTFTQEEFKAYKDKIMASKIPYKIENKYRYETGRVDYSGNIHSDTLSITSEPVVTVGPKTGFLKRPTYNITIGNKNPLISQSDVSSIIYRPERKTQFSLGPMALTDGKNMTAGLGVTIKRGIFSASVGYQFINTQK